MGLRSFLKSLHPYAHARRHRHPRGECEGPMWIRLPTLARPIEGTPFVKASYRDLFDHFFTSPAFVTVDHYPRNVEIAKGEVGYWAVFDGLEIYPVARIIADENTRDGL